MKPSKRVTLATPPASVRLPGLTFDTGALIGLERRARRIVNVYAIARASLATVTVPAPVIAEWWRARSDLAEKILAGVVVEPLDARLARVAGEACAATGATAIDAIVMASAASRGDVVYTSDAEDLERLRAHFPNVRVFGV